MKKWSVTSWGVGFFVLILIVFFATNFVGNDFGVSQDNGEQVLDNNVPASVPAPMPDVPKEINWEQYNYDFVDENVKGILNRMLGASGKIAFYLPPAGYFNVSRGSEYGVAYALNNPNPSGEDRFVFNWTAGFEDCGVGLDVAQGWIERGGRSWGKIPQGWIDHMTIYFSFPDDVEACSVAYDFVIWKDGVLYGSERLEFNLV